MHVARSRPLVVLLAVGVLLILMLAAGPASPAGPKRVIDDPTATPSWVQTLAGPADGDIATDVLLLKGDVMLVCGTLSTASGNTDISLTKYKGSAAQWTQAWNGPANGDDAARKMALSPDGKYVYICGQGTRAAANIDMYVLKRRVSNGNLVWAKKYDGSAHKTDLAVSIGVDAAGNVVVAGVSMNAADGDYVLASWKPSGAVRWTWRWDGKNGLDMPFDMLVTSAGDAYVTGASVAAGGKIQAVTARFDPAGKKKWLKKYLGDAGLGAAMSSIALKPGGGVYTGGWTATAATGNDAIIMKYATGGGRTTVATDSAGGGVTNELYWDVAVTSTKAIVGAGSTAVGDNTDPHVTVFSSAGAPLFTDAWLSTPQPDALLACATDAFGGWYVTGTRHVAPPLNRILTYRGSVLAEAGSWTGQYAPVPGLGYAATAIAVRDASCVVVGQAPSGSPSGIDQMVLMYNY
jgi:hypothetical protein